VAKMEEMIEAYGDRLDVPWFWEQLKTFVEKDLKSQSSHRQTRYQAADSRYDYDDSIFSIVFSYINALCHARHTPENTKSSEKEAKIITRFVQSKETNYRKRLARVDEKTGKIVKLLS
jgi:hypothetical protein